MSAGERSAETAHVDTEQCNRCRGPNVIWSAASPLWNYVMRGNDINGPIKYRDLVCMPCFILLAEEAGLPTHGWRLTLVPEPDGLIYETPSGRVWDAERFLWVESDRGDDLDCEVCGGFGVLDGLEPCPENCRPEVLADLTSRPGATS